MAILTLYPTSDISAGNWTTAPLWSKIDESVLSTADSIIQYSGNVNCYFTWTEHTTQTGVITDVIYYIVADKVNTGTTYNAVLAYVIPDSGHQTASIGLTTSPVAYHQHFTTNPGTGVAWTWTDIDALTAGIYGTWQYGKVDTAYHSSYTRVYQAYIEVVYTAVQSPTVTTSDATSITLVGCTGNGNITATGGENCTRRGFCYMVGTSGDPTTSNSVAYDDGSFSTGVYTKIITGLASGTNYRIRAYATNSAGTSYGTTVQVNTLRRNATYLIF